MLERPSSWLEKVAVSCVRRHSHAVKKQYTCKSRDRSEVATALLDGESNANRLRPLRVMVFVYVHAQLIENMLLIDAKSCRRRVWSRLDARRSANYCKQIRNRGRGLDMQAVVDDGRRMSDYFDDYAIPREAPRTPRSPTPRMTRGKSILGSVLELYSWPMILHDDMEVGVMKRHELTDEQWDGVCR